MTRRERVDELATCNHYTIRMRRLWLSVVMVIAFATGGVADALAWTDCPMLGRGAEQLTVSGHECCPDEGGSSAPDEQPSKMGGCVMGPGCRTAPAMTPTVEPIRTALPLPKSSGEIVSDTSVASRAPEEFWRPPRTI